MSRRLRFIPEGGALVEVTCRALHSRLLFRPSPLMNQIIIGTLARAKQRHDKVRVCFLRRALQSYAYPAMGGGCPRARQVYGVLPLEAGQGGRAPDRLEGEDLRPALPGDCGQR